MSYLNHSIPTVCCLIRNEYLYNHTKGHGEFTPCDVHSVSSLQKRVPLFEAFLENGASEQGSRMTAMDNATRNAGELVDKLTITYNRSRQAAITKELIEIISGAESL